MIAIEGLTKRFDRRPALDGLTLRIGDGDRIALIGSNGAGKTTLFRCLLGHYRYEGRIERNGTRALHRDGAFLSRVAFVPQLPPPLRMPVAELLNFAVRGTGATTDGMVEIAARLGIDLDAVRQQPFYRLSGGQKQKILVTIALARAADLLIFDEPAANLDPAARAAFIDILAERRGTAMLIASHRLEEVAPLVNRVIELDRGRIVLDDSVVDRLKAGEMRRCVIQATEHHEPFARTLAGWGFEASPDRLTYRGAIPSAESFRFLGVVSRYASLIGHLSIDTEGERRH